MRTFLSEFLCVLCICGVFIAGMMLQAMIDRDYVRSSQDITREIALAEANIVLKMDGYKIYFRLTDHGEIALVHPQIRKEIDEDI